ncbi:MAG TPA: histone deacetylase [Candidatus Aminicenantes bacterium]|nr:histone deacetylase [Candidatus Aminicenantes bacterium]
MKTGVVIDRRFMAHDMGAGHIESPARIEVLLRMLEEDPPVPYRPVAPRPATDEELGWVHERGYIDLIGSTAGRTVPLDMDTAAGPKTWETARLAAGGLIEAVDLIMDGSVRNALALVRPPGHHAEASRAMGFCIFNNVAVAAEHLIRRRGAERVLVVDWDLHHGNGTERAFYERRDVMYVSTHQAPFYPGTGAARFFGRGEGYGHNLNVPLLAGKGDADFLHVFEKVVAPVAAQYGPDVILSSAGFDIAAGDPLGGMEVTPAGFGRLAAALMAMADKTASGRLALVLEGGYNLEALREGVREVLKALAGRPGAALSSGDSPAPGALSPSLRAELEEPLRTFRRRWDLPGD